MFDRIVGYIVKTAKGYQDRKMKSWGYQFRTMILFIPYYTAKRKNSEVTNPPLQNHLAIGRAKWHGQCAYFDNFALFYLQQCYCIYSRLDSKFQR